MASKFDFAQYVEDNLDRVTRTSSGELAAVCPWCERYGSFYVNPDTGHFICFRCEQRGRHLVGLVAQVEGISWREAKSYILKQAVQFRRKETPHSLLELIRGLRPADDRKGVQGENPAVEVELPDEFVPVYQSGKWRFPKYLKERGITRATAREWRLGYCNEGKYQGRVIIPIECPNGRSFTARDTTGEDWIKILNPSGVDQSQLLIGWDHIRAGSDIALVEGPFDAIKWWQHGIMAVGLGGKVLHPPQLRMINRLAASTSVTIALDPEEQEAPYKLAAQLACRFDGVYIAQLPLGIDPGESTKAQAKKAYESAKKFTGRQDGLCAILADTKKKLGKIYQ